MNVRAFAAAVLVAALAVAAVGATGASGGKTADTLTVWLQVDAQSGWPEVVAAANAQFKAQNPGWDVVLKADWERVLAASDLERKKAAPHNAPSRRSAPQPESVRIGPTKK